MKVSKVISRFQTDQIVDQNAKMVAKRHIFARTTLSALGLAGEEVEDHRPSLIEPVVMRHGCPAIEYHRKA